MFQYNLVKGLKNTENIVLPEGNDKLLLLLHDYYQWIDITILGSKKQIENKVAELGAFDFSKVKLLVRLNLSIMKIT
jgi:phosphate acetyltransferase